MEIKQININELINIFYKYKKYIESIVGIYIDTSNIFFYKLKQE